MDRNQSLPAFAVASSSGTETQSNVLDKSRQLQNDAQGEEVPMHLDTSRCGPLLTVSTDNLCAKYYSDDPWNYPSAIRGNHPVPRQTPIYYFEVLIKDRGKKGFIGIGFVDKGFKMNGQPGWDPNSYGYHGYNGGLYAGRSYAACEGFGPTFSTGDTVGAGINYLEQELFFTKNGKLVDVTWLEDTEKALYPAVGLGTNGEEVEANFGQKPFKFDVEAFRKQVQDRLQEDDDAP